DQERRMNWKYIVPRAVLVLAIWSFFAFGFDPLLRRAAVATGQKAVGARVEIDAVETKFLSPALALRNVQIADRSKPDTNLIEFDEFRVRLEGRPLLQRAFVAEEAAMTG